MSTRIDVWDWTVGGSAFLANDISSTNAIRVAGVTSMLEKRFEARDASVRRLCERAFPEARDTPPGFAQGSGDLLISEAIPQNFVAPIGGIAFW
jgi:hypothetical protein